MIKEMHLPDGPSPIRIQVIRTNRKTLALEIKEDLIVRARIPLHITDKQLQEFVDRHKDWILKKHQKAQEEIAKRQDIARPLPSKEELEKILSLIASRVRHYEKIMDLSCNKITIRNQKTRWGSCSSKGNLNFNYRLAYMPPEILDYVVVHELAHLRHMNHSQEFWAVVEDFLPDYKRRRQWLKEHGEEY